MTNDQSTPRWEPDPAGDVYTLGTWQALVSHRGDATAAYKFDTAESACAWCERIIAERRAGR